MRTKIAFTFQWSSFLSSPEHVLWANPPFLHLDKIITKLLRDPCKIVLTTPEWRDYPWWKPLDQITSARFTIPPGEDIYLLNGYTTPLLGPEWGTVISLVDTTKWTKPFHQPDLVQWVQGQNLGRDKTFLLSNKFVMVNTRSGLTTAAPEPKPEAPS